MVSPGNTENKQELTRNRILHHLFNNPGASRQECAETLSISTFTVSKVVGELVQRGLVFEKEDDIKTDAPGRPRIPLHLNPKYSYFAGIEFDTQYWRFAVIDFMGNIVYTYVSAFPDFSSQIEFVNLLHEYLNKQIEEITKRGIIAEAFCIGAPGFIDREKGCIKSIELLPHFKEIPLITHSSFNTEIPIYITHHIYNLAYYNAIEMNGYRDKSIIHVVVRSGISACLSNSMKPFIGNHYLAGEIGLTDIGQGVFLQDIASKTVLQKMLPEINENFWEGDEFCIEEVYLKNRKAHHLLKRAVYSLARVLGNIQAFADSDMIILYCSFMRKNTVLWQDFEKKFYEQLEMKDLTEIEIICIEDPELALVKSAALFCFEFQYPQTLEDLKIKDQYLLKKNKEGEGK